MQSNNDNDNDNIFINNTLTGINSDILSDNDEIILSEDFELNELNNLIFQNNTNSTSEEEMILSEDFNSEFDEHKQLGENRENDRLSSTLSETEENKEQNLLNSISEAVNASLQKSRELRLNQNKDILPNWSNKDTQPNFANKDTQPNWSNKEESLQDKIEKIKKEYQNDKPVYRRNFRFISDNEKPDGIVGLGNLGNTCYMNSILQCLFNIKDFYDNIVDKETIKLLYPYSIKKLLPEETNNFSIIMAKAQLTLTYQLHNLFLAIWSNKSKHIRPVNFRNIFANKIQAFQSYEQQDSQEALLCILDSIHTEIEKPVNINCIENFISAEYIEFFRLMDENKLSDIDCCKMESQIPHIWELFSVKRALDIYNKKSYSFISNIFQNLISSTLQCPQCNYHTYNFDPSNILTVPIPNSNEKYINMDAINEKMKSFEHLLEDKKEQIKKHLITNECNNQSFELSDCFESLVHVEKLDDINKWNCPNCNEKVNAFKKISIWIPPKIMIIQIKRFIHNFSERGYFASKLNNMIKYPINDFKINNYMSDYAKKLGEFTYDLVGVTNHIGNINGGHYFAYVKSITDNNWYCMDDDNVTRLDENEIVSSNAYMLFYKLKE